MLVAATGSRPNIVFILSDDVGQGDLGCAGAQKVKTPHLERPARESLRFIAAHSTASVCIPTRFASVTGRSGWRQRGTGIAAGNATQLIVRGTPTVASLLQGAGYRTSLVGKWHLGLGTAEVDFNAAIPPGPRELGFGYAFFIPATGDRVPSVFIENDRVVVLDPPIPSA